MAWFLDYIWPLVTPVFAVCGVALSIFNTWYNYRRDKKELYITATFDENNRVEFNSVSITVVNKSLRPITVKEIGLKYETSVEPKLSNPVDIEEDSVRLPLKLDVSDEFVYCVPCCYFMNKNEDASRLVTIAVPYAVDNEGERYNGVPLKHTVYFVAGD